MQIYLCHRLANFHSNTDAITDVDPAHHSVANTHSYSYPHSIPVALSNVFTIAFPNSDSFLNTHSYSYSHSIPVALSNVFAVAFTNSDSFLNTHSFPVSNGFFLPFADCFSIAKFYAATYSDRFANA